MNNVFNTGREIDVRYDLKGSFYGRRTRKNKTDYIESTVALKDLDFIDDCCKIRIDPVAKNKLIQVIKEDVALFQNLNINDYSLLLGVHTIGSEEEA